MNTTKIVVALEMPNQIIANTAQIADETVFTIDSNGSKKRAARGLEPSTMPSGAPTSAASTNPASTRYSVMPRSSKKVSLCTSAMNAAPTFAGPGSTNCGIRTDASHQAATSSATSTARWATSPANERDDKPDGAVDMAQISRRSWRIAS